MPLGKLRDLLVQFIREAEGHGRKDTRGHKVKGAFQTPNGEVTMCFALLRIADGYVAVELRRGRVMYYSLPCNHGGS